MHMIYAMRTDKLWNVTFIHDWAAIYGEKG